MENIELDNIIQKWFIEVKITQDNVDEYKCAETAAKRAQLVSKWKTEQKITSNEAGEYLDKYYTNFLDKEISNSAEKPQQKLPANNVQRKSFVAHVQVEGPSKKSDKSEAAQNEASKVLVKADREVSIRALKDALSEELQELADKEKVSKQMQQALHEHILKIALDPACIILPPEQESKHETQKSSNGKAEKDREKRRLYKQRKKERMAKENVQATCVAATSVPLEEPKKELKSVSDDETTNSLKQSFVARLQNSASSELLKPGAEQADDAAKKWSENMEKFDSWFPGRPLTPLDVQTFRNIEKTRPVR